VDRREIVTVLCREHILGELRRNGRRQRHPPIARQVDLRGVQRPTDLVRLAAGVLRVEGVQVDVLGVLGLVVGSQLFGPGSARSARILRRPNEIRSRSLSGFHFSPVSAARATVLSTGGAEGASKPAAPRES
jgi:hypothetical protein